MGPSDVVFKVYFADGSYKSMLVNENDNTSKIVQTILEKVTFPKTKDLLLFVATRDTSGEVFHEVAENEQPGSIFKKWENEKQLHSNKFVFKKKKDAFKWKEDELVSISASSTNNSGQTTPPPTSNHSSPPSRPPPVANSSPPPVNTAKPPSRPPPAPSKSAPSGAPPTPSNMTSPPDERQQQPRMPPMMGGNPLMAELSMKRAAQTDNKVLLRTVPKKEQSQAAIIQWINKKLEESQKDQRIENLESDLKDGTILAIVLESLSGLAIKDFNRTPQNKIHMVENQNIILRFLKVLGVNLVNIGGEDLWEARPETMMRIFGIIIKHFSETNTKARLSVLVSAQQQQTMPVRKPPPPVRQPAQAAAPPANGVSDLPLPPPPSDSANGAPPARPLPTALKKAPAKPSAKPSSFVPKPPPTAVAKTQAGPLPVNTTATGKPAAPPVVKRPAVKPPPQQSQNGNAPVSNRVAPPPRQTPPPATNKPTTSPPPPVQARAKPALPPRSLPTAPSDIPSPVSRQPAPAHPTISATAIPPPPISDLTPISSPPNLPPPPSFDNAQLPPPPPPMEPIDEYSSYEAQHNELPPPPPPLPSTLPPTLSMEGDEYVSTPSSTSPSSSPPPHKSTTVKPPPPARNFAPPPPPRIPEPIQEPEPEPEPIQEPEPEPIQEDDQQYNYEQQQYSYEQSVQEDYSTHIEEDITSVTAEDESYNNNNLSGSGSNVIVPSESTDDLTFEDLESIINNNTFSFEDLLKQHNIDVPTEDSSAISYDMSADNNTASKEDDLDDLLDRLARGEV